MSGNKDKPKSEREKPKPIDPTLDIRSKHFDPLKALYSDEVVVPYKNAKVYDNISKYESVMKQIAEKNKNNSTLEPSTSTPANAQTKTSKRNQFDQNEPIVRRFLPHQEMVKGAVKERHSRNVLKKIDKGFGGPIDMLKVYMEKKQRVKIYTRKEHGLLGYITGFVESFDKHWNIVLSDVYEVWKRKKLHFCDTADHGPSEDCSRKLKKLKLEFPKVVVKSLNRKYVECTRRVAQLMVRGEQVAIVMLDRSPHLDISDYEQLKVKENLIHF